MMGSFRVHFYLRLMSTEANICWADGNKESATSIRAMAAIWLGGTIGNFFT